MDRKSNDRRVLHSKHTPERRGLGDRRLRRRRRRHPNREKAKRIAANRAAWKARSPERKGKRTNESLKAMAPHMGSTIHWDGDTQKIKLLGFWGVHKMNRGQRYAKDVGAPRVK